MISPTNKREIVLQVENVTKRFPSVVANANVSLTLHRGEILALLGENGAGKSTLMNIIYGLYHPDEGRFRLKGKDVHFASPREAIHSGIGMVHQHFQLIPVMTVAENVILGEENTVKAETVQMLATEDTKFAGTIRWLWGALWRLLMPIVTAGIGLLIGQVVLLLILTISTYLPQGDQFQSLSYGRLALLPKAKVALAAIYPDNGTLTRLLLWSPLVVAALAGALVTVLGYRHARQTWRGTARITEHGSGIDKVIDAVIDLFATTSNVQDRQRAATRVRELSRQFNLEVDPDAIIENLPVGLQQRVEIVKALYRHADILILDEPTAVLTPQEGRELFKIMKELAAQGVSIIFITHKLKEVFAVADSIVVMRGGKVVGATVPGKESESSLAAMMVGREVMLRVAKTPAKPGPVVLSVEDLRAIDERGTPALDGVSFDVHVGEVLGVAGVQGNGQTELVEVLTGLRKPLTGIIRIAEQKTEGSDPRHITMSGAAHVPEDRHRYGMVMTFPVADNLVLNQYYNVPFATSPSGRQLPVALLLYIVFFAAGVTGFTLLWTSTLWPTLRDTLGLLGNFSVSHRVMAALWPPLQKLFPLPVSLRKIPDTGPYIVALLVSLAYIALSVIVAHLVTTLILSLISRVVFSRRKTNGGLTRDDQAIRQNASRLVKEFDIRPAAIAVNGGNLSGGNQQKMVVAREFSRKPRLLIAAQPTRGIDVGSIEFIHQRIVKQRDEGAAVLLVSAELDEIMALSDRIAVMYKGQIIDIVPAETATREQLGLLMAGVKAAEKAVPISV